MEQMKTLANCKAKEFLMQTNKIRHEIANFYAAIGIKELKEKFVKLAEKAGNAEKAEALRKQYLSELLDSALEINADATVTILGLAAFKTPEEAKEMTATEILEVFGQLISCKPVIDFFVNAGKSGLFGTAST